MTQPALNAGPLCAASLAGTHLLIATTLSAIGALLRSDVAASRSRSNPAALSQYRLAQPDPAIDERDDRLDRLSAAGTEPGVPHRRCISLHKQNSQGILIESTRGLCIPDTTALGPSIVDPGSSPSLYSPGRLDRRPAAHKIAGCRFWPDLRLPVPGRCPDFKKTDRCRGRPLPGCAPAWRTWQPQVSALAINAACPGTARYQMLTAGVQNRRRRHCGSALVTTDGLLAQECHWIIACRHQTRIGRSVSPSDR